MSFLTDWLTTPAPDAAIEIAQDRVSAAVVTWRAGEATVTTHGSEALPPGAVTPSLTGTNIQDRAAVTAALTRLFGRLAISPARVALIVPDSAVKLSLVRFEATPGRQDDLAQLVRWQLRKSMPFPVEEATVSFVPGAPVEGGGAEFVVSVARRAAIEEYEAVCAAAGAHAGLVDVATVSLINLCLAGAPAPAGDWLLVHVRPDSTSIVIMRGAHVVFFRNRAEGEPESLADLVQQTAMYYQDRLAGERFSRVVLAGSGPEAMRRSVEERLGVAVEPLDLTRVARVADRIALTGDVTDTLATLVGIALRAAERGVAA